MTPKKSGRIMAGEDIIRMSSRELKRLHIVHQAMDGQMTQQTASSMLDLSERQVRRLVKSVRESGDGGIVHRGRGRPSNRRLPEKVKKQVLDLCRQKYRDFGSTLASEKLLERDGIAVNRETLRQWRLGAGLWEKKRKRRGHRQWRLRKGCFGEMVQIDGSHHAWLEDRGPELVLMGYIDDATNTAYAQFYDYEGTLPAMDSFKRYVRRYGLPVSVYLDKHSTYKSQRKLTVEEELAGVGAALSQFERALKELGVKVIHAHSPQAKGRIERLFGTLQDRLVKEMRLRGTTTREEANAFLREYLPAFNRRFQVPPANKANVHVKPEPYFNLDRYLCLKTNRTVRNDNTVAHEGKLYQIMEKAMSRKVIVEERIDGSLHLSCRGVNLKYREITQRPPKANPSASPREIKKPMPPSKDHPWRRSPLKMVIRKRMYNEMTK
jgi:transposase